MGCPTLGSRDTRLAVTTLFCAASSVLFASGTLVERTLTPIAPALRQDIALAPGDAGSPPLASAINAPTAGTVPPTGPKPARPTPNEAVHQQQTEAKAPSADPQMRITFEAVSIRPCESSGTPGGRGGNGPRNSISPGYASWGCATLEMLIDQAWGGGAFPNNSLLNTLRAAARQEARRAQAHQRRTVVGGR